MEGVSEEERGQVRRRGEKVEGGVIGKREENG